MFHNIDSYLDVYKGVFEEKKCCSLLFWIGLTITVILLWPLVAAPYFTHHDDVQVIRLFEMGKCIKDLQIPCRWVPDLGGMYGYPIFNYYAPLPYYIGEIFYFLSGSLILGAKFMFAIPFIGAYVFMYLLARKLWGEAGGVLSAIFYSLAPYHAVVFYVRGAMGEMWALMIFPALLWALLRLKDSTKITNVLLLSLMLSFLILSHNLSTLVFLPIFLSLAAIIFFQQKDFRFLKFFGLSLSLGFLLSAFYLVPMTLEKSFVHVETTTYGYFSYTEHFKGLRKLLLDNSWGWGASVREIPGGEKDGMSFKIGWVHLLAWLLSAITAKYLWKKNRKASISIIFASLIATVSIFMVNPKSEFVWKTVEPLKFIQFPWRFLMLIIFSISFMSGSIMLLFNGKYKNILWTTLAILVVAVNLAYFRPEKFLTVSENELLSGKNWDRQIKRSIFDFLPIYAKAPPAELATSPYEILYGDVQIKDFKQGTNWITFEADATGHSIMRLSQYYFPDWKVTVDGQYVKVDYENNSLGLMTIIFGEGNHKVEARLYDTPVRALSNIATVSGFLVFVLLIFTQIPKTRKWIFYYLRGLNR